MTDINTLAALLRGAAPALAIGEFLEEAATALEQGEWGHKAAAAEFSAYLVSIGQPAVPVVCANPHLEALAELLLP